MKKLLIALALAAIFPMASAQTAVSVNGQTISAQSQKELMNIFQAQGMTDEKQILNRARGMLIERAVVAQEVRKLKLDQDPLVREKIEALKHNVYLETLASRFFQDKKPTDEDLTKIYETEKANYDPSFIQFSMIAVKTESEAKEIIQRLNNGANFANLAEELSIDEATKKNGGQLPLLNIKQIQLPGLAQAAASVEPGKVIQMPFKSNDNYLVVKVDKKEERPFPPQEEIKKRLTETWAREQLLEYIGSLMKAAKISEVTAKK